MTTANILSQLGSPGVSTGFKNRFINGAMTIDQRYAGAATANTISGYTLDRWAVYQSTTGKLIAQQNAGSVTPPTGFSNYLGVTSQSAYSIGSSDYYGIEQPIEGFNTYDLAWGTANAKTVTLSFWVRSSLTGTFGGRFQNAASDYSYPFSYSIPVANTWTQISVTVAGPTSGTWVGATNGIGLKIFFGLGVGSTYSATAGSWQSGNYLSVTGATSVVGTNGATFYITGVQLEVGTTATNFDYRSYGTELALCQRYLPAFNRVGNDIIGAGMSSSATGGYFFIPFQVTPRTVPTGVTASTASGFYALTPNGASAATCSVIAFHTGGTTGSSVSAVFANNGGAAGQANLLLSNASGAQLLFTGCEL